MQYADTEDAELTAAAEAAADEADALASGKPYVERKRIMPSDKCGYINKNGNLEIPLEFSKCSGFMNGMAAVGSQIEGSDEHSWSLIDATGTQAISESFDRIATIRITDLPFGLYKQSDNFWLTRKDDQVGVIFQNGHILKLEFEEINPISHGLYAIRQQGKWGVITDNGKILAETKFDTIGLYSEGKVMVTLDGKVGYLSY